MEDEDLVGKEKEIFETIVQLVNRVEELGWHVGIRKDGLAGFVIGEIRFVHEVTKHDPESYEAFRVEKDTH